MMDRKMVNFIREQYPPGTRIRLNAMDDPYAPILPGTEGEVDFVDDEGQIFMKWNNGRTLPLAPGKDSFTVLPPKLTSLKLYMPLYKKLAVSTHRSICLSASLCETRSPTVRRLTTGGGIALFRQAAAVCGKHWNRWGWQTPKCCSSAATG